MTRNACSEYQEQLSRCLQEARHLDRSHRYIGYCRMLAAGWAVVGLLLVVTSQIGPPPFSVVASLALVFLLAPVLASLEARIARNSSKQQFYSDLLARLTGNWRSKTDTGEDLAARDHGFMWDLDVLGRSSLFQFLSACQTEAGRRQLVAMLSEGVGSQEIRRRQGAVRDLASRLRFREELYVGTGVLTKAARTDSILSWVRSASLESIGTLRLVCGFSSIGSLAIIAYALAAPSRETVFLCCLVLVLQFGLWLFVRRRLTSDVRKVEELGRDLTHVANVLTVIECEVFDSELLSAITARLHDGTTPSSRLTKDLLRLCDLLEARRNQFVALLGPFLLYGTQVLLACEHWRQRHGLGLKHWIAAVAELEALASIAGFAYEVPNSPYPMFVDTSLVFECVNISHPLLPAQAAIPNSITINDRQKLLLVSGSNMSGKSTLLRTMGISYVLGRAGGPVLATRATMTPCEVVVSIRTSDSLSSGRSRFSSELQRIQGLVDLVHTSSPVLLLLDELFSGTNSFDRFDGAVCLMQFVATATCAIGTITTHDRSVTKWAESQASLINVHFENRFVDGQMVFDYRLKAGASKRGNAKALMRSVGLPVSDNGDQLSTDERRIDYS